MKPRILIALLWTWLSVVSAQAAPAPTPGCPADALGTSRTLVVGTQDGAEIGLKSYPRTLPLADHELVLTFDDGPGPTTSAVLAALARECVKATFFTVGRNAEAMPDVVKREIADGHTVGHHTFSHPELTLRRMTPQAGEDDIERGFRADDLAAYGSASDAPRVPFFRFPGFADTPETDAWLRQRHVAVFGTDIWALDWLNLTPRAELDYLLRQVREAKRGIILLHDTRPSTAEMLPGFLRTLKAEGFKIVALMPGPGPAPTVDASDGWTSETDKVIAEVFASKAHSAAIRRSTVAATYFAATRRRPAHMMPRRVAHLAQRPRLLPHLKMNGAAKRTRTSTGLPTSTSS